MTDRDHFAAAALTGLLAQGDNGSFSEESYVRSAYGWADLMLRCRAAADCPAPDNAANHDAAPAATAGTPGTGDTQSFDAYAMFAGSVMNWISEATSAYASSCRSDGGMKIMAEACMRCWDAFDRIAYPTIHGASPEARASGDSDRTDKAAPRPSEGTGDTPKPINDCVSDRSKPINGPDPDSRVCETPVHTPTSHATPGEGSVPRDGTEPVAWAVLTADGTAVLHTSCTRQGSMGYKRMMERQGEVVPLYRQPTLTDAEREALEWAAAEAKRIADAAWFFDASLERRWVALRLLARRLG
jgi:hypothetical protein